MKWFAVVGLVLVRVAHAGPIEPLWETKAACNGAALVDWKDRLAWTDGKGKVHVVDRATGKLGKPLKLPKLETAKGASIGWSDGDRLEGVIGDDIVLHGGHFFAVVDGVTGSLRWRKDQPKTDGGLPYLVIANGDVLWVHPAKLGQGDPPVFVERHALSDGTVRWRGDMPVKTGQVSWTDADDKRLYITTSTNMIGPTTHVAAFDVADGKRLWTQVVTSKLTAGTTSDAPRDFAIVGSRLLYVMPGEGLHVLDGATGKLVAQIPVTVPQGAHAFATTGDRAFVATATEITAVDLATSKVSWKVPLPEANLLPSPAALYASDGQIVHAYDLADGRELATWGIAGAEVVYGTDARAPAFVLCDGGKRLAAFDPTGKATPVEQAVVTGKLECKGCKKHGKIFKPRAVKLGSAKTMTDAKRGTFSLSVEGRGTLELAIDLPNTQAAVDWAGPRRVLVKLRGKKKYPLGTLKVFIDCGPYGPNCWNYNQPFEEAD